MTEAQSIDQVQQMLAEQGYVCGRALATVVFLSLRLGRPLFLEGEAGVGKTEIAKALSAALGRRLIRLQCYEGLDAASAVYEWNFAAQMVAIRTAEAAGGADRAALQTELFSDEFLIERPLLEAMRPDEHGAPVLLIASDVARTESGFNFPQEVDQKKIYDEIARTRSTGVARGPFGVWLASAPLADAAHTAAALAEQQGHQRARSGRRSAASRRAARRSA